MGERFLLFYKNKLRKEYKIAFFSTFIIALLIHLYKFANTLPNHDSIYNYYADQNVLESGRWALSAACSISSYFDLPWLIGLFSCVLMGLTTAVIVALFKMQNPMLIALSGGLLAAAPATTSLFNYLYTADGYLIAMLLAALAVYFSRMDEHRISRKILSCLFICIACGIYQAYLSFALILAICYFIDALLQNSYDKKTCFSWILRQVCIFSIALVAYYIIWKLCAYLTGIAATDYQGISEIGKMGIQTIWKAFGKAASTVTNYFMQFNILAHGVTLYSLLNLLFGLIVLTGLVIAVIKSNLYKRPWAMVLFVLCLAAIIPSACIWYFTSPSVKYHTLMLESLTLIFILAALLYERWGKGMSKDIVCIFLMLVILNNAVMANINYFFLNLSFERTYADGLEMMIEIHNLQDEQECDKIAVIGSRYEESLWDFYEEETNQVAPAGTVYLMTRLQEKNMLYNAKHTLYFLYANFGLELECASDEEIDALREREDVRAMGIWPADDSVAVIDGILVLKLS